MIKILPDAIRKRRNLPPYVENTTSWFNDATDKETTP